jgi:hypothetical protein
VIFLLSGRALRQNDRFLVDLGCPRARFDSRELLATWLASLVSLLAKNSVMFVWLISHQPTVLFSTSNQTTVFFSQNKSEPATSQTNYCC